MYYDNNAVIAWSAEGGEIAVTKARDSAEKIASMIQAHLSDQNGQVIEFIFITRTSR